MILWYGWTKNEAFHLKKAEQLDLSFYTDPPVNGQTNKCSVGLPANWASDMILCNLKTTHSVWYKLALRRM